MSVMHLLWAASVLVVGVFGDEELAIPGSWPKDVVATLDKKAVIVVGGSMERGGGKINLVDADTVQILKTAPLPEGQSAGSVTIVPINGSTRGAAVIGMDTQMIGIPNSVYMVSLEDATFGNMLWKWAPSRDAYGDIFNDHNAAVARDSAGRYIYVASGKSTSPYKHRTDGLYTNNWWLHTLDVTGSDPTVVQTIQLPTYIAKSYYSGFGVFPSPDGHVLVNSNMAGVDGAPIVLVENAANAAHNVRNITFTVNEEMPVFVQVLSWDASGKGFYVDAGFITSDQKQMYEVHVHYDLHAGVIASSKVSGKATRVEHMYYNKGCISKSTGMVYYPTHASGTWVQGLVAAIDTASLTDTERYQHIDRNFWPMAVTVVGDKLWVAWNNIEKATLNRYTLTLASNTTILV